MINPISKRVASAKVILMKNELAELIEGLAKTYGEDVITHENLSLLDALHKFEKRIEEMGRG